MNKVAKCTSVYQPGLSKKGVCDDVLWDLKSLLQQLLKRWASTST